MALFTSNPLYLSLYWLFNVILLRCSGVSKIHFRIFVSFIYTLLYISHIWWPLETDISSLKLFLSSRFIPLLTWSSLRQNEVQMEEFEWNYYSQCSFFLLFSLLCFRSQLMMIFRRSSVLYVKWEQYITLAWTCSMVKIIIFHYILKPVELDLNWHSFCGTNINFPLGLYDYYFWKSDYMHFSKWLYT